MRPSGFYRTQFAMLTSLAADFHHVYSREIFSRFLRRICFNLVRALDFTGQQLGASASVARLTRRQSRTGLVRMSVLLSVDPGFPHCAPLELNWKESFATNGPSALAGRTPASSPLVQHRLAWRLQLLEATHVENHSLPRVEFLSRTEFSGQEVLRSLEQWRGPL